ncbi:MAG: hypothetical protein ABIH89_07710 [Elusimicrobiota bacterium]
MDVNLVGWGMYYPPYEYTNEDLCRIFKLPLRKAKDYEEMLGVKKRQMCIDFNNGGQQMIRDDQMATEAAKDAMKVAGIETDDIDMIISSYTTMDYITPGVAERIQSNLKIVEGHAMNLVGGCAEFINAIIVAKMFIEQGKADTILITVSEVVNAFYKDFTTTHEWFIAGDNGGAIILSSKHKGPFRVRNSNFKTVGRVQNIMPIPIWGVKVPCPLILENEGCHPLLKAMADIDDKYRWPRRKQMKDTLTVFIKNMHRIVNELTEEINVPKEEAYPTIPQFNMILMREASKSFNIKEEHVPLILVEHGCEGTSAPIATFLECYKKHKFADYNYVILLALGINGSYGGVLLEKIK